MTSPFTKPSAGSGGFFKPADHVNDLALIVEPKSIKRDVPNEYQGKTTLRDELTCDITVFRNSQNVEQCAPHDVLKNVVVDKQVLTKEATIGEVMLARVGKPSGKNYYAWLEVTDAAVEAACAAYFEKREGAIADALADVPDFE